MVLIHCMASHYILRILCSVIINIDAPLLTLMLVKKYKAHHAFLCEFMNIVILKSYILNKLFMYMLWKIVDVLKQSIYVFCCVCAIEFLIYQKCVLYEYMCIFFIYLVNVLHTMYTIVALMQTPGVHMSTHFVYVLSNH